MTTTPDYQAVLADRAAPLAQLMKALSKADEAMVDAPTVRIGISASITVDVLGVYLRREAALAGLKAQIVPGDFDDPIGNMGRLIEARVERVILLPFFDTILPAFEAQLSGLDPEVVSGKLEELRHRYRLALERAAPFASVHLGLYHRFGASAASDGADPVADVLRRCNDMLREEATRCANVQLLDTEAILSEVGRAAAFDHRFYLRSKAPYSTAFLGELARRVGNATRGFGTRFYKALALDCDNTLWGGIIGEDLLTGIKLDPFDYPGNVFWRVQQDIAALQRAGLLLCLCTKNNPADVEEVLRDHPNMVLKDEQIVARRVNWTDKVANLESLAAELNIGLDSMIFLDDSSVEAESVRSRLPMVRMMQVPSSLADYPRVIQEIAELYLSGGVSGESRAKTEQYRVRSATTESRSAYASHEEYLASLELKTILKVDAESEIPRISELSMKSNQFNLTTRRYPEATVRSLMQSQNSEILSVTVSNRFGSSGLTGIAVLLFKNGVAHIDNFLMSCRVLGQGVEFSVWRTIAERCRARGATLLEAEFIPTAKNTQVASFYDRLGLELVSDEAGHKRYRRSLDGFEPQFSSWIKVTHE